jgi:hypothetical protein
VVYNRQGDTRRAAKKTSTTDARPRRGLSDAWAALPRRRCNNCGKSYKPSRPEHIFHSELCRKQYHKHGGAYIKLKALLEKMVQWELDQMRSTIAEIVRDEYRKTCTGARHIEPEAVEALCNSLRSALC